MIAGRRLILALALVAISPLAAHAGDAPQTSSEKHRSQACWDRAEAQEGDALSYPLKIFAASDADVMAVNVDQKKWQALPRSERVVLMRDLACSYAGGRMKRDQWQPFGAVDATTDKTIETFTVEELFPKSGNP